MHTLTHISLTRTHGIIILYYPLFLLYRVISPPLKFSIMSPKSWTWKWWSWDLNLLVLFITTTSYTKYMEKKGSSDRVLIIQPSAYALLQNKQPCQLMFLTWLLLPEHVTLAKSRIYIGILLPFSNVALLDK